MKVTTVNFTHNRWMTAAMFTVLMHLLIVSCGFVSRVPPDYHPGPTTQKIPYIVRIEDDSGAFRGTGFLVSKTGLVITVSHVVRYTNPVRAILDGKVYMAELVSDDPLMDMTIIRLPLKGQDLNINVPCIWESETINSGDPVTVLGQLHEGEVAVVPAHMISWASFKIWPGSYQDVLRVYPVDPRNAPKPGFSGGPILDSKKHVIGLFCCLESLIDHYYNGIPSNRILTKIKGTPLMKEICTASDKKPFPLPGFTYDTKRISNQEHSPVITPLGL